MLKEKYGVDDLGWWSQKISHVHGVGCWKSILASLEHFKSLVHFEVRIGTGVLFWRDVWCRDRTLKDQFVDLSEMAYLKDTIIQEVVSWNGDSSH